MRLIVKFTLNTEPVPTDIQTYINAYIHKCLGADNKYHDAHSDYSISLLLGQSFNSETNTLDFKNGGKLVISSLDQDFLEKILLGITYNPIFGWGMKYINVEFVDEKFYDGVNHFFTLSPILLKDITERGKYQYCTVNDANFDDILTSRTLAKLTAINNKLDKKLNLNGFKIECATNGKNKVRKITVKNVINVGSTCIFTVHCNKKVAELLYNVGIGQSTGSGFGSICTKDNIQKYK